MILGGKRAGHVARRSGYAVGDKFSCFGFGWGRTETTI